MIASNGVCSRVHAMSVRLWNYVLKLGGNCLVYRLQGKFESVWCRCVQNAIGGELNCVEYPSVGRTQSHREETVDREEGCFRWVGEVLHSVSESLGD